MNSRVLREIPLKILHKKVGDERLTLLQACYDNPIFEQQDSTAYATQNGPGKPTDYGVDVFEDGMERRGYTGNCRVDSCHVANDYMHSLPVSPPLRNDIVFRSHRKRSRVILLLLILLVIIAALTVGLLVHFVGNSTTVSSPLSSSPVLSFTNVQGSLRIIAGPFSVYSPSLADCTSSAFLYLRNAFVFKMDTVLMSSMFANMYNKTQMLNVSGNKSHVQVSFVIQPQLRFTTTSLTSFIDNLRSVIINGFKNSIFVIDKDSLELKAVKPLPPPVFPAGECQPVVLSECVNRTNYSITSFPNLLGHRSQVETEQYIRKHHNSLFPNQCHFSAAQFFCSIFVPECGAQGKPIPPCRKYCVDVLRQCHSDFIKMTRDISQTVLSCEDLPDSTDPKICKQNPLDNMPPGSCIPFTNNLCSAYGYNQTTHPNIIGGITVEPSFHLFGVVHSIQESTKCYKHSLLFACYFYFPPCSGKPVPYNTIPVCASLCQEFRDRCEIFMDIFDVPFPQNISCSQFPDSPDPTVCLGYQEARALRDDFTTCSPGELKCGQSRCIKQSWLCDGYQDCDDDSDEASCAMCQKNEISCSPATGQCINKSQGCDGTDDCYMGVDEQFCVRMETTSANDVLLAFNSGTSQWEEVCRDNWTQALSSLVCKQLGYRKVLTTYFTPANVSLNKSIISERRNGSDPGRLQSYLSKGYESCPSGFVVRLICMNTECGIRPAYFKSPLRIVGGDDVNPGTYPWMASLHGGKSEAFFCGSTIIHEQWILTAAHCVGGGDVSDYNYWTIKTGSTRRVAFSKYRQIRKPKAIIKYPAYNLMTVDNDLALIQLEKPLTMNDFVRPICLPESSPEVGTRCYAVGWGKIHDKAQYYESNLRQVAVDVTTWEYCKLATSKNEHKVPYSLTHTMFCAGGSTSHDACQGDSGGPLLCRKDNTTDEWYQGGIVSWGVVCGTPNTPGVYTKLALYTDWIRETIANHTEP